MILKKHKLCYNGLVVIVVKKKKFNYNLLIYIFTILISLIFMGIVIKSNMVPTKYMIILSVILLFWNILIGLFFTKFKKKKIIGYILSFILFLITIFGTYYLNSTLGFFKGFGKDNYKEENFLVLVLKDSTYQELKDLENKKIGYVLSELTGINKAIENLNASLVYEKNTLEDYDKLLESLYNKTNDAIIIEENQKNLIDEHNEKSDDIRILYTINIKTKLENKVDLNVTNQPFAVYLTGIDTYGSIKSVSRSDVNIVAVVNPNTKQVLLITIPRDYYVQISGTKGLKDKLTHAGIYGIDTSMKTIEDLLELDISYYFKVNFSSVIKIVDRLDGIDVYSKYSFSSSPASGGTYRFTKGYNHLNGKQALAFVRERKASGLAGGDRSRGENQQAVISGLINKMTSSAIITKYTKILNDLNGTFQTNMEERDITSLVKMQLNDMAKWNVTSISLDGYDARDYTYSYPSQKLYVMKPKEETVNNAINLINRVENGEILEKSYDEPTDIKNPTEYTPSKPTPKPDIPSKVEIKKPTISLVGESNVILLTNQVYEEAGVSISVDLTDTKTNLESVLKVGSVDEKIPGVYKITYSITDIYKNTASVTRTIYVLEPLGDYDNDGFTNKEEIDANTNPLDATSHPNKTTPTEPIEPSEPVLPIEPIEPVEPEDPTKPTEPVEPIDPANPENPVIPTPSEPNENA